MKDLQKPCRECAFSRSSTPGELGGSDATVYIGQCAGPFFIPCHMTYETNDQALRENLHCTGGCAGAAVFRANLGVDVLMPKGINRLPADHEAVFSTNAEFLAHHRQISISEANEILARRPPLQLLKDELNKAQVVMLDADRKPLEKSAKSRTP